jgi:hypothetical protein
MRIKLYNVLLVARYKALLAQRWTHLEAFAAARVWARTAVERMIG